MAKIISLVNQKGGTGKTTTAINLSAYLAGHGKYVLLVDLDPQGNATSGIGLNPNEIPRHLYHTLVGGLLPEDTIRRTKIFGCDIIPSSPDLAGAGVELVNYENREFKLYEVLRRIRTDYDFIIIDCPPSLGILALNGIVAADDLIIPVQCEYYALEGLGHLLQTFDLIKENLGRDNLKIMGALLTMYDRRNKLARQVKKEVELNFPGYVFDTVIPRNISLAEAPSYGKTILEYNPFSKGARAYRQLAEEILHLAEENL